MDNTLIGNCKVCNKESTTKCGHCMKVTYCSSDCQKTDRKRHRKDECYPCQLVRHEYPESGVVGDSPNSIWLQSPHWVTTRNIKANELIFVDTSVMSGPSSSIPEYMDKEVTKYLPVCLACHKILDKTGTAKYNVCGRCKWPVCNSTCENKFKHAGRECPYLVKANLQPKKQQKEYKMISILRTLLLKCTSPTSWKEIMSILSPNPPPPPLSEPALRRQTSDWNNQAEFDGHVDLYLTKMGLGKYLTHYEVSHVVLLWDKSSFPMRNCPDISQSDFLCKTMHIAHSCVINVKPWNVENPTKTTAHNIYAATDIPAGTPLLCCNVDDILECGTPERRLKLARSSGFWCKCGRCADPTELGTYMSALLCKKKNMHKDLTGYLVPKYPLKHSSIWMCLDKNCQNVLTSDDMIKIVQPIAQKVQSLVERATEKEFASIYRSPTTQRIIPSKILGKFYEFILEMEEYDRQLGEWLPPNHHLKLKLRKEIMCGMNFITSGITQNVNFHEDFKQRDKTLGFLERMYVIARHNADIADIITPGLSIHRGYSLFYVGISRWASVLMTVRYSLTGSSKDKRSLKSIVEQGEEATEIVCKIFDASVKDGPIGLLEYARHLSTTAELSTKGLLIGGGDDDEDYHNKGDVEGDHDQDEAGDHDQDEEDDHDKDEEDDHDKDDEGDGDDENDNNEDYEDIDDDDDTDRDMVKAIVKMVVSGKKFIWY